MKTTKQISLLKRLIREHIRDVISEVKLDLKNADSDDFLTLKNEFEKKQLDISKFDKDENLINNALKLLRSHGIENEEQELKNFLKYNKDRILHAKSDDNSKKDDASSKDKDEKKEPEIEETGLTKKDVTHIDKETGTWHYKISSLKREFPNEMKKLAQFLINSSTNDRSIWDILTKITNKKLKLSGSDLNQNTVFKNLEKIFEDGTADYALSVSFPGEEFYLWFDDDNQKWKRSDID